MNTEHPSEGAPNFVIGYWKFVIAEFPFRGERGGEENEAGPKYPTSNTEHPTSKGGGSKLRYWIFSVGYWKFGSAEFP